MKVQFFLEGESDWRGLQALWRDWIERLRMKRQGMTFVTFTGKAELLRKIGDRADRALLDGESDLIVSLPDLHPIAPFRGGPSAHVDFESLIHVQRAAVEKGLKETFRVRETASYMDRYYPCAFRHDFEMLLLAAHDALKSFLGAADLPKFSRVVEGQDLDRPPKRIVEECFLNRSPRKRAYRETIHAPAVLSKVGSLRTVLFDEKGQPKCPRFQAMVDWLSLRLGEPAY